MTKLKALPLPRFIDPASIAIGDMIRITWTVGAVEHTRTAIVADRQYEGPDRVLTAKDGQEIMRWHPAHKHGRVTLLKESPESGAVPLFEMPERV